MSLPAFTLPATSAYEFQSAGIEVATSKQRMSAPMVQSASKMLAAKAKCNKTELFRPSLLR